MKGLARAALARFAWALVVVWAVVTIAFFIDAVLPSDPARLAAGPQARAHEVDLIRTQLGLDRPVAARYGAYLGRLVHVSSGGDAKAHATCATFGPVHVDLGKSYVQRRPVVDVIAERFPRTAWLAVGAVLVQTLIGVGLGTFAASRAGTPWDRGSVSVALVLASLPTFLVGVLLQYVLAFRWRLLPIDGYGRTTAGHVACVVLPAISLGLFGAAYATRLVRDEVAGALAQDHARTARAKGASRAGVVARHGLRNALAPVATATAVDLGTLLGGAVVVETLFRWPGLGAASVNALLDRDGPVMLGVVLVTSMAVVAANLVVDVAYAWLDPRVRAYTPR
jgi:peptide/nickel transport system permease protein